MSLDLHKTAYLTFRLHPLIKLLFLSFLLKMMPCCSLSVFGRGQKQGGSFIPEGGFAAEIVDLSSPLFLGQTVKEVLSFAFMLFALTGLGPKSH